MRQQSLSEARETSGRPAREIAETLGLSRSQLYRVESGECRASFALAHRMRAFWPKSRVPDLAIYDPREFEKRRDGDGRAAA